MRKCTILSKFLNPFDGCNMSQKLGTGPFLTLCSTAASCNNKDSQNMLMILCTVDQIFKVFIVLCLETLFWNYFTTCRCSFLHTGEPLSISTKDKLCLSLFLYPIILLICCHLIWLVAKCFSTTFLGCIASIKFKMS